LSPVGPFGALCVPASSRGAPGSRKVNSPIIPGLILEAFPASFRIPKRPYPSFRVRQFLCMPYVHQENQYFKNKCFFAGHKCVWYCKYGVQLNVAEFVPKLDAARARLLFCPDRNIVFLPFWTLGPAWQASKHRRYFRPVPRGPVERQNALVPPSVPQPPLWLWPWEPPFYKDI
jgi:hypothetical protein